MELARGRGGAVVACGVWFLGESNVCYIMMMPWHGHVLHITCPLLSLATTIYIKTPPYWSFALRIHWWPVDFPHKAPDYSGIIMSVMGSQINGVSIVFSTVCPVADLSSVWLAFVRGIHRSPVYSPHKRPATRKIFPFDDVIMSNVEGVSMPWCRHSNKPSLLESVSPAVVNIQC